MRALTGTPPDSAVRSLHDFEFVVILLDRLSRIEIKQGSTVDFPFGAVQSKHDGSRFAMSDGFHVLHAAPLDGFELDRHPHQRAKMVRLSIPCKGHAILEFTVGPAEPAGFAALSGKGHEFCFQPFAASMESRSSVLQTGDRTASADSWPGVHQSDAAKTK
jgi:hypothetical protein